MNKLRRESERLTNALTEKIWGERGYGVFFVDLARTFLQQVRGRTASPHAEPQSCLPHPANDTRRVAREVWRTGTACFGVPDDIVLRRTDEEIKRT